MGINIAVIPDSQVKPGVNTDHLVWAMDYIIDKQPDVIVHLGDFADLPSLSSHDKAGSKAMEGKRYMQDVKSVHDAMAKFLKPLRDLQAKQRKNKEKVYKPRMVMLGGNHENRIDRAISNDPRLEGLLSLNDLKYNEFGWETVPFLKPIEIEGVLFCHYMSSGVMGRPVTSARALLTKHHQSVVVGHQQGRDIAFGHRGNGNEMTALIAGSYYQHDEDYLNYQTNNHWHGIYFLHDVTDGEFDEMALSLKYLKERYERKHSSAD